MNRVATLPNFLITGAAKAGTSSLHHYLGQHPQVFMSPIKEPRFFAPELYTEHIKDPFRGGAKAHRSTPMSIEEYTDLFAGVTDELAVGESSTEYLYLPQVPERIQRLIPNVKLITILRDPAERAFSAFCYQVRDGCERLSFEQALVAEEDRVAKYKRWPGWQYRRVGFYYEQVKRYFDRFDRSQIKIYLHEDLGDNSGGIAKDTFDFLEIDDSFTPELTKRNISAIPKSRTLQNLMIKDNPLKTIVKPLIPQQLRTALRSQNLSEKPALSPITRQQLVKDYREDILKLQDLIERDLSTWLV